MKPHFPSARIFWVVMLLGMIFGVTSRQALAQGAANEGNRVALVIGNADYKKANALKNPTHDAKDIGDILTAAGFKTTVLKDLPKKEMLAAIRDFSENIKAGAVAAFYFSGHGIQYEGENYLVGIDAEITREFDIPEGAVSVGYLMRAMSFNGSSLKLIFLDCCRNVPKQWSTGKNLQGLATVHAPAATLIGFATSPGATASDGSGNNSPYASALKVHLATPGTDLMENLRKVANSVHAETEGKQRPWKADDLLEKFVMVPSALPPPDVKAGGDDSSALTVPVNDDLIQRIILFPKRSPPGGNIRLKVESHSNRVRSFALFPTATGKIQRVEGTWNRAEGGLIIDYRVPETMRSSKYIARVFVQPLDSNKESKREVEFEVFSEGASVAMPGLPIPRAIGVQNESLLDPKGRMELEKQLGFVPVPGGKFRMGTVKKSDFDREGFTRYDDERPVREVTVKSFELMKHELTHDDLRMLYALVRDSASLKAALEKDAGLAHAAARDEAEAQLPVKLTWSQARMVVEVLSQLLASDISLPTEAEWEYAARGGLDQKDYPWGNREDTFNREKVLSIVKRVVNADDANLWGTVRPVMTVSPPNGFGLYDIAGNVWEWTSSIYQPYPYKSDASRESPEVTEDQYRVIRGGGVEPECTDVRVGLRGYGDPVEAESRYGLRLVRRTSKSTGAGK